MDLTTDTSGFYGHLNPPFIFHDRIGGFIGGHYVMHYSDVYPGIALLTLAVAFSLITFAFRGPGTPEL